MYASAQERWRKEGPDARTGKPCQDQDCFHNSGYGEYYDAESIAIVAEYAAPEIQSFGYSPTGI